MRKRYQTLFFAFSRLALCLYFVAAVADLGRAQLRILVSNDDGIDHPGTRALVARLAPLGEVVVAAPSKNQSGVGHGATFPGPIPVATWERDGVKWFSIAAMPSTCVRLALTSLLSEKPDFVVAGINKGANVGVVTFSSGTVACAREAAYRDIPALSVNLEKGQTMDYAAAADFVAAIIPEMKAKGLPRGTYLNINIPARPKDQVKGVLVTKQDLRPPDEHYKKEEGPAGETCFLSVYKVLGDGDPKSDTWALSHGFISITPLQIDQTQCSAMKAMETWGIMKRNQ
jgi:5'-nucleotidase